MSAASGDSQKASPQTAKDWPEGLAEPRLRYLVGRVVMMFGHRASSASVLPGKQIRKGNCNSSSAGNLGYVFRKEEIHDLLDTIEVQDLSELIFSEPGGERCAKIFSSLVTGSPFLAQRFHVKVHGCDAQWVWADSHTYSRCFQSTLSISGEMTLDRVRAFPGIPQSLVCHFESPGIRSN